MTNELILRDRKFFALKPAANPAQTIFNRKNYSTDSFEMLYIAIESRNLRPFSLIALLTIVYSQLSFDHDWNEGFQPSDRMGSHSYDRGWCLGAQMRGQAMWVLPVVLSVL